MRVDVAAAMDGEVTVCNCIPATEQGGCDMWKTTTLVGFWHEEGGSSLGSAGTASASTSIRVQIAESDACGYVPPSEYDGDGWTLRPGDRVARGTVDYEGTLSGLLAACEGMRAGTVTKVKDLRLGEASRPLSGIKKWASVLYCEAV